MMSKAFLRQAKDPFIDNIVRNIPDEVKLSFTEHQAEALLEALSKAHVTARHKIDARITVNLFFGPLLPGISHGQGSPGGNAQSGD